jgi:UDP-glucose 4-epimerase
LFSKVFDRFESQLSGRRRVYVNERARTELVWRPKYDVGSVVASLRANEDFTSLLTQAIGSKGYHAARCSEGPYPIEHGS